MPSPCRPGECRLLLASRPGVVSSDSGTVSLDQIFVKDSGSSPSSSWASPSSRPDPPRSLLAGSASVGVVSLSGVLPLMWVRQRVDGAPGGCPSTWPWYRPYCSRRTALRSGDVNLTDDFSSPGRWNMS